MTEIYQIVVAVALGFSLAACVGFRAFLPFLALSLLAKAHFVTLSPSYVWLQSNPATLTFCVAALLEICVDLVPGLDHMLDTASTFIKPVAGFVMVSSLVHDLNPFVTNLIALLLGGGVATMWQTKKALLRTASSVTTAGIANPFLSLFETVLCGMGTLVSFVIPILAALLIGVATVVSARWMVRLFQRLAARRNSSRYLG